MKKSKGEMLHEMENDLRFRIAEEHYRMVSEIVKQLDPKLLEHSTRHKDPTKMVDVILFPTNDWVAVELQRKVDWDKGLATFQSIVTFCFDGKQERRGGGKPFHVSF